MLKDGYQYDYLVIIANFAMLKWQNSNINSIIDRNHTSTNSSGAETSRRLRVKEWSEIA